MNDAQQTRERILEAATDEFAAHGIAGARVDRIAAASGMSKPMLYAYFGNKHELFDAVFTTHVISNNQRIPVTANDLPGYAARLYDDYIADPALMRLLMWKRLERESFGYLFPGLEDIDADNFEQIERQQRRGQLRSDMAARDIWSLVISSATAWAQNSVTAVATAGDLENEHSRRRAALKSYVHAALDPLARGESEAKTGAQSTGYGYMPEGLSNRHA